MKNKGFTLIELLAVIVILAIIALIATPIILNIIEDAREESNKRSIDNYARAVKNAVASYQLKNKKAPKEFADLTIDYEGNVSCETSILYEDGSIYLAKCTVNGTLVEGYTYGNDLGASETASTWEQDGTTIYGKLSDGTVVTTLNVGDTIAYDAYTGVDSSLLTYTATTTMTGNDSSIAIHDGGTVDGEDKVYTVTSTDTTRTWTVMGVKDGKVLITTDELSTELIFGGGAGINNAATVLNNIGAIYGHGNGAESGRSIDLEDIENITGIEATQPYVTLDENYQIKESYMNMIEFTASDERAVLVGTYWLASTSYYYYGGPGANVYDVIRVSATLNSTGKAFISDMGIHWDGNSSEFAASNSVKPVVVLKADIALEKNTSTGAWDIK